MAELLADPPALARHLAWLDGPTSRPPGTPDASLASALLKLADGLGPDRLDARESFAVLASAPHPLGPRHHPAAAAQMKDL